MISYYIKLLFKKYWLGFIFTKSTFNGATEIFHDREMIEEYFHIGLNGRTKRWHYSLNGRDSNPEI